MQSTLTVGRIISLDLRAVPVLEQFGIDCKLHILDPIESVCREVKLNLELIFSALLELDSRTDFAQDCNTPQALNLLEFLDRQQRRIAGTDLGKADRLLTLECDHLGFGNPWLGATAKLFHSLEWELLPHLISEQHILFPQIRVALQPPRKSAHREDFLIDVADAIRVCAAENNYLLRRLDELQRNLSDCNLIPLAGSGARRLSDTLQDLCEQVRQHIQLEDQLLFPFVLKDRPHLQFHNN